MPVLNKGVWTQDEKLDHTDVIPTLTHPEAERYHLYISYACPYAHRVNLVAHYLGLTEAISISSVDPKNENGWAFSAEYPDPLNGADFLWQIYTKHQVDFSGRAVVPAFWDKQTQKLVSNTSAELALDLATNWLPLAKNPVELVPAALRDEIMAMTEWLNTNVTGKVYTVGFAKSQCCYDKAQKELFDTFTELDARLASQSYLFGEQITLADFFLFPTLIRFESVYAMLFKCNAQPLSDFSNLYRYMLDLYNIESIRATVDVSYTKLNYFYSFAGQNPSRIVPAGPQLAWVK